MVRNLKDRLYFLVASYFWFFARIRLAHWKPRIVVITGSNGKTTTLGLIEAQLGPLARYSHHANSSFGIPFDILGLRRTTLRPAEWIILVLSAPFAIWKKPYPEKIYIVEADCDRPGEGMFLSTLLQPEVVVWLSSARTHSKNFEKSVARGRAQNIEEAIAREFAHFIEHASRQVIINADNSLIVGQSARATADVIEIHEREQLEHYTVSDSGTTFTLNGITYALPYLLPRETVYGIAASLKLAAYLDIRSNDFTSFAMPPGRSSLFRGIQSTTIVDSSYNANVDSVAAILHMTRELSAEKKWAVIGDLTEQGKLEKEEHEKIAHLLREEKFEKIIIVGPRLARFARPILMQQSETPVLSFQSPREALDHIQSTLTGGEMLIFKGARFLEGVIEHLLADPADRNKLCRREAIWRARRKHWGL